MPIDVLVLISLVILTASLGGVAAVLDYVDRMRRMWRARECRR